MRDIEWNPFGITCACGNDLLIGPFDRTLVTRCERCYLDHGPFEMWPSRDSLPHDGAALAELIHFIDRFNPSFHFRKLWGQDCLKLVRQLAKRYYDTFEQSETLTAPPEELLMCLYYCVNLGAYGVDYASFNRWLINQYREAFIDGRR